MASVNGLVHVRAFRAEGLAKWAGGGKVYLRVRLSPWRQVRSTGSAIVSACGDAVWGEEAEALVLPHLSTTTPTRPSLCVELRCRELYVYERAIGRGELDVSGLLSRSNGKREELIELNDGIRVLVSVEFARGAAVLERQLRPATNSVAMPRVGSEEVLRQHLFRLKTYTWPTWCAVCHQLLKGLRHQGFQCEACGLDCHSECQLKAHAVSECLPRDDVDVFMNEPKTPIDTTEAQSDTELRAEQTRHHKLDDALSASAVESGAQVMANARPNEETPHAESHDDLQRRLPPPTRRPIEISRGSGRLKLHLKSVRLANLSKVGDHYVRTHVAPSRDSPWLAGEGTRRTHTVYESSEPRFDVSWHLPLATFSSEVRLELVEASRDVVVGTLKFGVLDLLQEEADAQVEEGRRMLEATLRSPALGSLGSLVADALLLVPASERDSWQMPKRHFLDDVENCCFRDRSSGQPTAVARFGCGELTVYSDELWFSASPRDVDPEPYPEMFSIEIARRHIERAKAIVRWISDTYAAYERLMRWTEPLVTAPLFVTYVAACLWLDAEHAGIVPLAVLCCIFAYTARKRLLGAPKTLYFRSAAQTEDADLLAKYRPLAYLKMAVCAGRGLDEGAPPPDVYVAVAFANHTADPSATKALSPKSSATATTTEAAALSPTGSVARRRRLSDNNRKHELSQEDDKDLHECAEKKKNSAAPDNNSINEDDDDFFGHSLYDEKSPVSMSRSVGGSSTSSGAPRSSRMRSRPSLDEYEQPTPSAAHHQAATAKSSSAERILGYTATCRRTGEPRWHGSLGLSLEHRRRVDPSAVISRLVGSYYDSSSQWCAAVVEPWARRGFGERSEPLIDRSLVYPVLRPRPAYGELAPWGQVSGAVVFRVMRQHPLDRLLDKQIGVVSVPVSSLVDPDADRRGGPQRERRAWFDLELDDEERRDSRDDTADGSETATAVVASPPDNHQATARQPALNLRLQLVLRPHPRRAPSVEEVETSRAVEAMTQPLTAADEDDHDVGVVIASSSEAHRDRDENQVVASVGGRTRSAVGAVARNPISAVTSMHANTVYAQNLLGGILDVLESCKNALNWTHPSKTAVLFATTVGLAALFWRCPTRWLALAAGLYEFTYRLVPFFKGSPMTTRLLNLLKSLPNDEDLRRCYEHRANSHARKVARDERRRRRRAKLHGIWRTTWQGNIGLRELGRHHEHEELPPDVDTATATYTQVHSTAHFEPRYLVLHGRRLLWWQSEKHLDAGKAPAGQLLLQGHSGLTDPSPTDLAAATPEKKDCLLAVFGQATDGAPLRCTVLLDTLGHMRALADAIQQLAAAKLD